MVTLDDVHEVRSFVLLIRFVLASSSNKPFGVRVTGSWSKRGMSTGTISIRPSEFTRVAMLARSNTLLTNVIGAGATKGTPFAI